MNGLTNNLRYPLATLSVLLSSLHAFSAPAEFSDSVITLNEVSVTAQKTGMASTYAATKVSGSEIARYDINSLKDVSAIAPNFFIPDYGSQMTTSIYVRGLGSRIDQASVGLNLDNIPVLNKETYDFELIDVDRIEIIRGPQALMYGRNTMGGVVNVHTLSPMDYQGVHASAEISSGLSERVTAGYYTLLGSKLGMSLTAGIASSDGFWRNDYNGEKVGRTLESRGRWRTVWRPSSSLTIDNVATGDYARQKGYPYEFIETGRIAYNDTCFYRRATFNDGITVSALLGNVQFNSVTSFQYVNDNVTLDQDFTTDDYFTLSQVRHEWAITQDFTLSGRHRAYSWLAGLTGFYRRTNMSAPVNFERTGIDRLILANIPAQVPITWADDSFILGSVFTSRNRSVALYHQSSVDIKRFTISVGLRYDIEQAALKYHSETHTGYVITTPMASISRTLDVDIADNLHQTFREYSPKATLSYRLPSSGNTLYATVSRGFKAGGYNTQMFSDILQQEMMATVGVGKSYDPADIIAYRPERSMNYEIGYNGTTANRRYSGSATLFWMEIHDQQMTAFPEGTTTGRIMTNAARTRSRGVELALTAKPIDQLTASVTYGLTDARFRHFNNGLQQLDGNRVPYAPTHTLFTSATWQQRLPLDWMKVIEINTNLRATGPIYWDDANTVRQKMYFLLGASVTARLDSQQRWAVTVWGENLTATQYNTFYFVSIENKFLQRGRPQRFGLTVRYAL